VTHILVSARSFLKSHTGKHTASKPKEKVMGKSELIIGTSTKVENVFTGILLTGDGGTSR
jgi:hypothetical protein